MTDWNAICAALRRDGVAVGDGARPRAVGGGSINAAWKLPAADGACFVKTGPAEAYLMFDAEAAGLRELAGAGAVHVPRVLAAGRTDGGSYLALEWLDLGRRTAGSDRRLGGQLAALHRVTHERHGWHRDNTIGATPQHNAWHDDWVGFLRERRLGFQLRLAHDNGYGRELGDAGEWLLDHLGQYFDGYTPAASLLHGDLWGGNCAAVEGEPVVFDPAVYYGDRESDLAMTRLFGGFGEEFYAAYAASWPLAAGHEARSIIYRLYHVLNHLNLFGGGYLGQAQAMLASLRHCG